LEASSGYIGIVQNGPILQNPKEDYCNNHNNSQDCTSLTNTHDSNKWRLLERSYHTKTQQMTAIKSATEMEKHKREDLKVTSNQTTNTTHHVAYQDEATPNQTRHSHYHQDKEEKNQTQHQGTHQPEEENPSQLCNPKAETLTTMATHVSKNQKYKCKKQRTQQSHQTLIATIDKYYY
jgi:hypothetical protein